MDKLLPTVVGLVVQTSSSIAFDAAVKLATPTGVSAVKGFLIKGAASVLGAMVAGRIASVAVTNTEGVVEILKKTPAELEPIKAED